MRRSNSSIVVVVVVVVVVVEVGTTSGSRIEDRIELYQDKFSTLWFDFRKAAVSVVHLSRFSERFSCQIIVTCVVFSISLKIFTIDESFDALFNIPWIGLKKGEL